MEAVLERFGAWGCVWYAWTVNLLCERQDEAGGGVFAEQLNNTSGLSHSANIRKQED